MQSLKDVIAALRAEIEAGLALERPLPYGAHLQADRVVATLQFCITEMSSANGSDAVTFSLPPSDRKGSKIAGANPLHSLTIEFKPLRAEVPHLNTETASQKLEVAEAPAKPLPSAAAEEVARQLASLFGPPSFDSAARATVFREAFENLSSAELQMLIRSLRGTPVGENDTAVKRSLSLLNRVLKSGPSGLVEGKAILVGLLERHSLPVVIQLVTSAWKSQQDWMS